MDEYQTIDAGFKEAGGSVEILRLEADGDIVIHDRLIGNDPRFYDRMCDVSKGNGVEPKPDCPFTATADSTVNDSNITFATADNAGFIVLSVEQALVNGDKVCDEGLFNAFSDWLDTMERQDRG